MIFLIPKPNFYHDQSADQVSAAVSQAALKAHTRATVDLATRLAGLYKEGGLPMPK